MKNDAEIQFDIARIIISEKYDAQAVFLAEVGGQRDFTILIGLFEAVSIDRMVRGDIAPRPLTHYAWLNSIETLGARVTAVAITSLVDDTYYSEIRVKAGKVHATIDVRPSDAIAMALLASAPILIKESVLEAVEASS